jgi:hypothetical protein
MTLLAAEVPEDFFITVAKLPRLQMVTRSPLHQEIFQLQLVTAVQVQQQRSLEHMVQTDQTVLLLCHLQLFTPRLAVVVVTPVITDRLRKQVVLVVAVDMEMVRQLQREAELEVV